MHAQKINSTDEKKLFAFYFNENLLLGLLYRWLAYKTNAVINEMGQYFIKVFFKILVLKWLSIELHITNTSLT